MYCFKCALVCSILIRSFNNNFISGDNLSAFNLSLFLTSKFTNIASLYSFIINDFSVYIPNTFTPDGDQFNTIFQPIFSGEIDPLNFGFWIFNRWGELVFESHDINAYWDGNYGQNKALEGHDSYFLTYMEVSSKEVKTLVGSLSLLK